MKEIMITVLLAGFGLACKAQVDSTIIQPYGEIERYDFVSTKNGMEDAITERDGWVIEKRKFSNGRAWYDEYAPASEFYMIQKDFRPNGMIWRRTKYLGYVRFGMYEEFDEEGKLTKLIDEDKKFGKIKPQDIVELLEKEGWFNRKTGENKVTRKSILPTNGEFYMWVMPNIVITFMTKKESKTGKCFWGITVEPRSEGQRTNYIIDGETGEFTKEEEYIMRYE
ncbi:hypothetical protein [Bacteroides ovatus]|uniref:hypothetical protein n=1 Tax=Bacteroides ovatus TaxID=28116 RepID=UPI001E40A3D8|nr:hypothetical protein [Bacteroides ovatus]MDC2661320.1 hypothetical protein [Bacteroides ovatus]